MNLDLVPQVLVRALGSAWSSSTVRPLTEKDDYAVVAVDRRLERVVVKLVGAQPPHWVRPAALDRAPYLAHRLRELELPVPEVLAVDTSCGEVPVGYAIFRALPGIPLATVLGSVSPLDLEPAFVDLGAAVARVHGLAFPAFGELDAAGRVVDGRFEYASALTRRASVRLTNAAHVSLFQDQVQRHRRDLQQAGSPALTHEDLNPTNLLVEQQASGWRLSGMLDWDAAWAGCPESDLARLSVWRGMHPPVFWRAYQALRRVPDGYARRQMLLALLWCLEYASPTESHHAATARVCAALGIQPIRFI